jgi:flavin reductase (DIM6/NTAB) family NADH-FMN oxidoreductase RutF
MSADNLPSLDPQTLGDALHLLPAPVAVIGAAAEGELGGLTAAWLTRVSHAPPLLLVSIGHERYTYGLLCSSRHFTVSILQEGQVYVARHFGLQSRREVDKWATVPHLLLGGHTPALARCAARLLCAIRDSFRTGDHDCFVGEIIEAEVVDGGPSLPLRDQDYAS